MKDYSTLNMKALNIDTATLSITDFTPISAKVAKVVVTTTGHMTQAAMMDAICEQLKYAAAPVEKSFRAITAGNMVGYVRANRTVRPVNDDKELRASYRVMSNNILMDNKDKSLWEVREGAGGKYLARHGNEDLSSLVSASLNRTVTAPRLHQVTAAAAASHDVVAFVTPAGDMDYGFCVAASSKTGNSLVVSSTQKASVKVPASAIVASFTLQLPKAITKKIEASGISRDDVKQQTEYWRKLYNFAPDYMNDVIKQVEDTAAM